jgi:predicted nucleotidyltransferase
MGLARSGREIVSDTEREFRPGRITAALADNKVRYVAVGAVAVIAHGVVRATRDVDIVPDPAPDNLARLASAIQALQGAPRGEPDTPVTAQLLGRDANMRFDTEAGQLDVLCAEQYRRLFPELDSRAMDTEADGVPIRVVSRNDLIRLKAGSGRDRDLLDIGDLLALEEQ